MSRFLPYCALALTLACPIHAAERDPAAFDAGPLQWKRSPELLVPAVSTPPVIDGTVDLREWTDAAGLGPLKVGADGKGDDMLRQVWLMHDGRNIYIAFRLQRPSETLTPTVPESAGRYEMAEIADAARAMFAPGGNFEKVHDFWLFANGAFGDALYTRGQDLNWNAEWQHATRMTLTGWEGEMAIPFAAFGLQAAPSPGEWWGFDFVDQRTTPSPLAAHWSYRGRKWDNFENFGRIRFAEGPAVRLVKAGRLSNGKFGLEFTAINTMSTAQKLKVSMEVLARKPSSVATGKSYYDNIESGVAHDAQAEFTKGTSLKAMIDFAESSYEPVTGMTRQETIEVPVGLRRVFGLAADVTVGEYLGRYRVEDERGAVVGSGVTIFDHETPLELKIEPYWLYSQVIDVFADLSKTGLKDGGELVCNILRADGQGAPLKTSRDKVTGTARTKGTVSVDGLQPGFYQVEAILYDATGKELARNASPIQRPETPEWFKNDLGNKTEVPAPWTPLQADAKGIVSMWGRTYDLSQVLPAAVTSQGEKVLAEPIQLRTLTAAGPVKWAVKQLALKSQSLGKALYDVALEGGGLRIAGTMRIEFDGLIWYDLEVNPVSTAVEVKSMTLDIPVEAKLCELMSRHKFLADPVLYPKTPEPELNGRPGLLQDARLPFTPYIWIGKEKAGMGFMAEAPMDWSIDAPNRLLETKAPADGAPGRILVNFIQKSTPFIDAHQATASGRTRGMRLAFGLQATPIREAPKDYSILNIYQKNQAFDDEKEMAEIAKRGGKVVVFYYGWRGNETTELGGTPERPIFPEVRELLKRGIATAHKHGLKVILYTGWGVNATSPSWQKFSYELGKYPIENKGWGTFEQSAGETGAYQDFMAWGHADIAREYGADGVLWDSASNIAADQNLRIGNAWIDDQGRTRPKYALLATRDLYRRIYNIYHSEVGRDGIVLNHAGSLWPINVFADMQNRGEGRPMSAKSLRECWTPFEEFRSEYSGEPFGSIHTGEINDWGPQPMRVSLHLAVTLLHGAYAKEIWLMGPNRYRTYAYENRPLFALWETFGWLPMNGTETKNFYYLNAAGKYQAVKADPASLLSSVFTSGDKKRAIVIVSNLDETPIPDAKIHLRTEPLGLLPGLALKVQDGITLEPIELKDDIATIAIDQQRYRVLKVWVD